MGSAARCKRIYGLAVLQRMQDLQSVSINKDNGLLRIVSVEPSLHGSEVQMVLAASLSMGSRSCGISLLQTDDSKEGVVWKDLVTSFKRPRSLSQRQREQADSASLWPVGGFSSCPDLPGRLST